MKELFSSGGKLHWMKNLYWRYKYGAGCCDTFGLCHFLAPRILRPLKRFKKHLERGGGYPADITWEEWHKEINEMIWAFEYLVDGEDFSEPYNFEKDKADGERMQKGFELFGKRFRDLWI